jgi:hypothetical protein
MFTVVGVAAQRKRCSRRQESDDNIVFFPLATFRELHRTESTLIGVKATSHADMSKATDEMRELLRAAPPGREQQARQLFCLHPGLISDVWNQITGMIFIFMFAVSSVGLIVGGVGVMNIMLVSVTERTRELECVSDAARATFCCNSLLSRHAYRCRRSHRSARGRDDYMGNPLIFRRCRATMSVFWSMFASARRPP